MELEGEESGLEVGTRERGRDFEGRGREKEGKSQREILLVLVDLSPL